MLNVAEKKQNFMTASPNEKLMNVAKIFTERFQK